MPNKRCPICDGENVLFFDYDPGVGDCADDHAALYICEDCNRLYAPIDYGVLFGRDDDGVEDDFKPHPSADVD